MEHPRRLVAIVPPESPVAEIIRATPPDAECAVGMDIIGYFDGSLRAGKIVCTTWPNDSSTYIAVSSDGSRLTVSVDEVLDLHERFVSIPGVTPVRVSIQDRHLGWHFDANEGDVTRILKRSAFPDSVVVEYVDAEERSAVGVSVAQKYLDETHIGICFGKQVIGGQVVYLVIFDDGVVKGMSYRVMKRAVERFWTGYSAGTHVPIRAVL